MTFSSIDHKGKYAYIIEQVTEINITVILKLYEIFTIVVDVK